MSTPSETQIREFNNVKAELMAVILPSYNMNEYTKKPAYGYYIVEN